jgi:glycosyltransferase involved in cell wall biosynthesis
LGIHVEDFAPAAPADGPLVIGYLARICPEKGLRNLCDAFIALRRGGRDCRLRAAGYLGAGDRDYFDQTCGTLRAHGCHEAFEYVGEVSRGEKAAFLRSIHVFSVPTVYHEAKGLPVLEAQAAGVPAVQPRHGSFPELLEATGGGVLYSPGDPGALAAALGGLLDDAPRRAQMGQRAAAGVRAAFTDAIMAEKTWSLYERFIR